MMGWYDTHSDKTAINALRGIEGEARATHDRVYRPAEEKVFSNALRDNTQQHVNVANSDFYQQLANTGVPPTAYGGRVNTTNRSGILSSGKNQARLNAQNNRAAGIADAANLGLGFMGDSQENFTNIANSNNQMMIQRANIANNLRDSQLDSTMTGLGAAYQGYDNYRKREWVDKQRFKDNIYGTPPISQRDSQSSYFSGLDTSGLLNYGDW
jgi:hypothetical protein